VRTGGDTLQKRGRGQVATLMVMVTLRFIILAIALGGCQLTGLPIADASFRCVSNLDCGTGSQCVEGRCRSDCGLRAELCTNGRDDDCNGFVDCADVACACDAGAADAGTADAGTADAGTTDAGTADAGTADAGTADAGTADAGRADAGPPPPEDTCGNVLTNLPDTVRGRFSGAGPDRSITGFDCSTASDAADVFYEVQLRPNQVTHFKLNSMGADVVANLSGTCSFASCWASAVSLDGRGDQVFSYVNSTSTLQVGVLALSVANQRMSNAQFELRTTRGPLWQEACGRTDAPISSSTTFSVLLSYSGADHLVPDRGYCWGASGQEVVVPLLLPARSIARIRGVSPYDIAFNVVSGTGTCFMNGALCVAGVDRLGPNSTQAEELVVENPFDTPAGFQLLVSTYEPVQSNPAMPTTVSIQIASALPPGDVCSMPDLTPLLGNTMGTYSLSGLGPRVSIADTSSCVGHLGGAERVHRVVAGSGQRVDFTLTPSNFTAALNAQTAYHAGCGSDEFCHTSRLIMPGNSATSSWYHTLDVPREMSLFVAARGMPRSNGSYQLSTTFAGERCSANGGVYLIQENTKLMFETFSGNVPDLNLVAPGCANPQGGADRVFRVAFIADAGLTATVESTVPVSLNLLSASSCATGLCLRGADSTMLSGGMHQAVLNYRPAVSGEGVLVVSARGAPQSDAGYSLAVTFDAGVPAGDTCGEAIVLTLPAVRTGQALLGLRKNYSLSVNCTPSLGAEAVYAITVPADRNAIVEVNSNEDAVINVVPFPAWNCNEYCDTSVNRSTAGSETATIANRYRRDARYFILVSRATVGPMTFDLSVALQP
jgi:hypothetical protein